MLTKERYGSLEKAQAADASESDFLTFLIEAQARGEDIFEGCLRSHADWTLIHLILRNDEMGRGTSASDALEIISCARGTMRAMLSRLSRRGLIATKQKVGRTELLQPTPKLRERMESWNQALSDSWSLGPARHQEETRPRAVRRAS